MTRHPWPSGPPPRGSYANLGRISSRGAAATQPPGAVLGVVGAFVSAAVPERTHPISERPATMPASIATTNLRRLTLDIVVIVWSLSLAAGYDRSQLFRTDYSLSSRHFAPGEN